MRVSECNFVGEELADKDSLLDAAVHVDEGVFDVCWSEKLDGDVNSFVVELTDSFD